jgi:hypothetical protein
MMPKIEFFYWADCPSHERAYAILQEVMALEHIQAPVEIIEVKDEIIASMRLHATMHQQVCVYSLLTRIMPSSRPQIAGRT